MEDNYWETKVKSLEDRLCVLEKRLSELADIYNKHEHDGQIHRGECDVEVYKVRENFKFNLENKF